jgi:hypothetical protein
VIRARFPFSVNPRCVFSGCLAVCLTLRALLPTFWVLPAKDVRSSLSVCRAGSRVAADCLKSLISTCLLLMLWMEDTTCVCLPSDSGWRNWMADSIPEFSAPRGCHSATPRNCSRRISQGLQSFPSSLLSSASFFLFGSKPLASATRFRCSLSNGVSHFTEQSAAG